MTTFRGWAAASAARALIWTSGPAAAPPAAFQLR
jgi:hypothetical protein